MDTEIIRKLEKSIKINPVFDEKMIRDAIGYTVQQYTIFLVEDDSDDRSLAIDTLRKSPYIYNIHSFESGDLLLAHLDRVGHHSQYLMQHIPTLIMLDIHTPGTDGLKVLRDLKTSIITKDIPVVILTGDTSSEAVREASKCNANGFITKPLCLDHVHEVIYASWEESYSKA